MIAYLKGNIVAKENYHIILDVNGVGYQVHMNEKVLASYKVNEECQIYTYQHVREDALILFGFESLLERKLFMALTSVSGIGPKAGMAFLSMYDTKQIVTFIVRGDALSLSAVPGIGKKSAERLSLELKDKIINILPEIDISKEIGKDSKVPDSVKKHAAINKIEEGFHNEIKLALSSLGYSSKEIESAVVGNIDEISECENVEAAIKIVLKQI